MWRAAPPGGAGRAASAGRCANACKRTDRRETGHAGRGGAWVASRRDVRTRARGAGGVTCDTAASRRSPHGAPEVCACVVARVWLREGKQCYGDTTTCYGDTKPRATERHTTVTRPVAVARARCVMAHTAHACWLSRAPAGHLGPGGACHRRRAHGSCESVGRENPKQPAAL